MKSIEINAEHYRFTIEDHNLSSWASRYHSKKEARASVVSWLRSTAAAPIQQSAISLPSEFVLCANEVFPEAALSDPLADLDVWEEWRSGKRRFPYPGVYPRLSLATSESKTRSTTSIGVFGEILSGLFGQSVIAPFVLVRVVRRWPDFIWTTRDAGFAFLESKAHYFNEPMEMGRLESIPTEFLLEPCADVVQELTAEPHLTVWLAISIITSVRPTFVRFCLLEFHADSIRKRHTMPKVPAAVVASLADVLILSGTNSTKLETDFFAAGPNKLSREDQRAIREQIKEYMHDSIDGFLRDRIPQVHMRGARESILTHANKRLRNLRFAPIEEGKHQLAARQKLGTSESTTVRQLYDDKCRITMRDLDESEIQKVEEQWQASLDLVAAPFRVDTAGKSIRCSTSVLSVLGL